MQTIPLDILQLLRNLTPGVRAQIILHTNGDGEWKTEVHLFHGVCTGPPINLQTLLEQKYIAAKSNLS